MPDSLKAVTDLLTEAPTEYMKPRVSRYNVNYYAITPKGSKSRFTRTGNLTPLLGAQSETAVQMYLRTLHPGCEIMIMGLNFS